ncbi:MAG TPA: TrkA family potassium uptake protein [Planctomycetota bacterium]|nr:TrkA family potassium uptake protein [Planctomycetota bacterium]
MRQFAVIGLGSFGLQVARRMAANGGEVLVVDLDEHLVDEAKDFVQRAVIADATDDRALAELGLDAMDAVLVCLGSIQSSVLAVLHLRELKVKRIVAMAVSSDHVKILNSLGADRVIYPEQDAAERLANSLSWGNVLDHVPLAPGFSMLEAAAPDEMIGKTLKESGIGARYGIQIIAVKELVPDRFNLAPRAEFVIKESDILIMLGRDQDLERFKRGE